MGIKGGMRRVALACVSAGAIVCGSSVFLLGGGVGSDPNAGAGASSPAALEASTNNLSFPATTLGTYSLPLGLFTLTNTAPGTDTIDLASNELGFSGPGSDDYLVLTGDCPGNGVDIIVLTQNTSCQPEIRFLPGALGERSATMFLQGSADTGPVSVGLSGTGSIGYYQVSSNGVVANFGDAAYWGDASDLPLNHPIVGIAQTGDDGGYWLVASDGGIFNYGDAGFFGSAGSLPLNKPIVGMASTHDGGGYWLVASDGGIFDYGNAPFYGSTGSMHLNQPIVGMAATPDGGGYWLVASDGGIFAYGDANFYGSRGGQPLNKPIVGMAATPDGGGYWLVASDGGIFSYGDARFYGSTGALHLNAPINGMAVMPDGGGYWFTASDGGLFDYGDAPFAGSSGGQDLGGPVVAMTTDGEPTIQAVFGFPALRPAHLSVDRSIPGGARRDAGPGRAAPQVP